VPFVTANGVRLHALEMGSGSPVVMLHGLLVGNLATWYFGTAPVIARRHRVILYDLRGHGMSERAGTGYTLATMAADLSSLIAGLGLHEVSLVGHSYGGLVALRWALDHPGRVIKLALVEATYPPSDTNEIDDFLSLPADRMLDALPASARTAAGASGRQARKFRESVEFLAARSTLLEDLRSESGLDPNRISQYGGEVLCVCGESSGCRSGGENLGRLFTRGRQVVLPGGHYLPQEAPSEVADILLRFLDE
jgi:pimeloyl-ACP methyl ester carboxylesterase